MDNCPGCADNQPAQEAHYGGCLPDPREEEEENNKRKLADVQGINYGMNDYPNKKNKN